MGRPGISLAPRLHPLALDKAFEYLSTHRNTPQCFNLRPRDGLAVGDDGQGLQNNTGEAFGLFLIDGLRACATGLGT